LQAKVFEIIEMEWNPIFGDFWPAIAASGQVKITTIERPLLQRDRLVQLFGAMPKGSYGYYAGKGLKRFEAIVGSMAGARIDQVFAAMTPLIMQPFSQFIENAASDLETTEWDNRKAFFEWLAGLGWWSKAGKWLRQTVVTKEFAAELAAGKANHESPLVPDQKFTEKQAQEFVMALAPAIKILDAEALSALGEEFYQEAVRKNRIKSEGR
jgi:hypothetical protein